MMSQQARQPRPVMPNPSTRAEPARGLRVFTWGGGGRLSECSRRSFDTSLHGTSFPSPGRRAELGPERISRPERCRAGIRRARTRWRRDSRSRAGGGQGTAAGLRSVWRTASPGDPAERPARRMHVSDPRRLCSERSPRSPCGRRYPDSSDGGPCHRARQSLVHSRRRDAIRERSGFRPSASALTRSRPGIPTETPLRRRGVVFVNATLYVDGGPLTDRLRETLIELGQDVDLRRNGQTPLHVPVHSNAVEVAAVLLDHGANVNAVDTLGRTPLHVAASGARVDVLRELLARGADATLLTNDNETAFELAPATGDVDAMRLLIMRGVQVDEPNVRGWTPLHTAAFSGQAVAIRELVGRGADIDVRTEAGVTPLHRAAAAGSVVAIRELVGRGATCGCRGGAPRSLWHISCGAASPGTDCGRSASASRVCCRSMRRPTTGSAASRSCARSEAARKQERSRAERFS